MCLAKAQQNGRDGRRLLFASLFIISIFEPKRLTAHISVGNTVNR